jgi:hypothetical protein
MAAQWEAIDEEATGANIANFFGTLNGGKVLRFAPFN